MRIAAGVFSTAALARAYRPPAPVAGGARPGPGRDVLEISPAAREAAARDRVVQDRPRDDRPGAPAELSGDEQREVQQLKQRDREVRAHEQAHLAAAGELASGGPSYELQRGPDGHQYAVGGHVDIELRSGRTPEETVRLAKRAQAAANAPADPSPQDHRVAARAAAAIARAEADARAEAGSGAPTSADGRAAGPGAPPPAGGAYPPGLRPHSVNDLGPVALHGGGQRVDVPLGIAEVQPRR